MRNSTTIEHAVKGVVDEKLLNPEWCNVLALYLKKMRNHDYGWIQDVIIQIWDRYQYDLYDAYCFANVFAWIGTGEIVMARVCVGSSPLADKNIEGNNHLLGGIGNGFRAEFWGGTQDDDGYFEILTPILMNVINEANHVNISKEVKAQFPLEVGYCSSAKVMIALNSCGKMARWPYGDEWITLLYRLNFPECRDGIHPIPYKGRTTKHYPSQLTLEI